MQKGNKIPFGRILPDSSNLGIVSAIMNDLKTTLKRLRGLWRKQQAQALAQSPALLKCLAQKLRESAVQQKILTANQKDLAALEPEGPIYERLLLNENTLNAIARDMERIGEMPSPVGEQVYRHDVAAGANVCLRRAPIGLVLVIYESRPNVTLDLFALALRTGNLLLLKGGKEAANSNAQLVALLREVLKRHGLNAEWVTLLGTSREELCELLKQREYIDLCIPRGSAALIHFVRETSQIPLIETGAGVVHLFCDETARPEMAARLIYNSKMRRLGVCNALDCLLLHRAQLGKLPQLLAGLAAAKVRVHCDAPSWAALDALDGQYPRELLCRAHEQSYGQEFLSAQLCIKVVESFAEAIEHIERYGSRHTEVIVTEDAARAERFCAEVDAAAVFVNMASGFSDGGQFGLGAEVGISTQKLHARGPMGLEALTCTKWFGRGSGQVRG